MKKKFFWILGIVFVVLFGSGFYIYSQDNYRFKLEYEVYNKVKFTNGKTIEARVPSNNKIKYVKEKDLKKILTTGTSVVYFGYPTCPWCRNIVPILMDVMKQSKIDIYYVDVEKVSVKEILPILNPYLESDKEGEKRLYVPDVYFIKDGEIVSHHLGTVESYKNAFLGMNKEQKQELKEIYQEGLKLLGDERNEK